MKAGLLTRTIALGVAAAALIAAAAFAVGWHQFHAMGSAIALRALGTAHVLQTHLDDERRLKLESETNAIAADADFVAATIGALHATGDGQTSPDSTELHNQVESRRTQHGFDAIALLNAAGTTLVTSGDGYLYRRDLSRLAAVAQVRKGAPLASGMLDADGRLYRICVASLPGQSGTAAALLLTARYVDEATLRNTAALSMTDRALIAFGATGPRIAASTLGPDDAQALTLLAKSERPTWQALAGAATQEPFEIDLGGRTWYAQIEPMPVTANSIVRLTLAPPIWHESVLAAIAPPLALAAGIGIAVVALALGTYWFRTVRPLMNLEPLVQRVRHGDYALHGTETGSTLARRTVHVVNVVLGELGRYRIPPGTPRRRETDLH